MYSESELLLRVFDLSSRKIKASLNGNSTNEIKNISFSIQSYIIVLISVSCIAFLLLIFIFIYVKTKHNYHAPLINKQKSKKQMNMVWSNPKKPNIEQVLSGGKNWGLYDDIVHNLN
jgi:hypothetical protein